MQTIRHASTIQARPGQPPSFAGARDCFESTVHWLEGEEARALSHSELEAQLADKGREMLRRLLQDHLDLRAWCEPRLEEVVGADGAVRSRVETGHGRGLLTVFGEVKASRLAYRRPGQVNLYPADAALNMPIESQSHGLRRLAALEASRGSFEGGHDAIERATGQRLGKRQVEELAQLTAADFDAFYAERKPAAAGADGDLLVLSCDGKGIVMRPEALRPATAEAAAQADPKFQTRLSPGEKRNRKRVAEVGAVYDAAPAPRTPVDVLASSSQQGGRRARPAPGPVAKSKWLVASVTEDAAQVVRRVFEEAERRDPEHRRTWVALVDGNNHQIERIKAEARSRGVEVAIVVDLIHVLEYVWKAARCFYKEDDPAAESWVLDKALEVLDGEADGVAEDIRRQADRDRLDAAKRRAAEQAADYLAHKAPYLDYPTALAHGWPIATGVIEGACRHLVKDRMDITGARWGLAGAEAVLKLRALVSNGDFDTYWRYHLLREHQRVHATRYAGRVIPRAA